MKQDRVKIHSKYGGCCAYCGKVIKIKEMQVDHVIPQWMDIPYRKGYGINVHDEDNLNPSCRRCNHYKRGDNLEQFRHKMLTLHERAASHYIGKVAIDYGIISLKPFDGKFYFEKYSHDTPTN